MRLRGSEHGHSALDRWTLLMLIDRCRLYGRSANVKVYVLIASSDQLMLSILRTIISQQPALLFRHDQPSNMYHAPNLSSYGSIRLCTPVAAILWGCCMGT